MAQQDPELVWRIKSKAIFNVYKRGGRYTLVDHNDVQWVIERRPEVVYAQIKRRMEETLAAIDRYIAA